MSAFIIDPSALGQFFVQDTYTQHVTQFFLNLDPEDIVYLPEFGLLECINIIWKQVRFHNVQENEAKQLLAKLLSAPLTIQPMHNFLERSLEIGLAHQLVIYDSAYIALAENLGLTLISVDAKQIKATQAVGVMFKPITDFAPPQI